MKQKFKNHYRKVCSIIFTALLYSYVHPALPYSFDIGSQFEIDLHSKIQFDDHRSEDCSIDSCKSKRDGWRIADINARINRYTGSHSLVFVNLDLSIENEDTPISQVLEPVSNNLSSLNKDNSNIDEAVFGYSYKQHDFSIGKHQIKTNPFGPSINNYLSFSLSGFDDDRIDWFSYEVEESIYASSSGSFNKIFSSVYADSLDLNGVLGVGLRGLDKSRLSLIYDLLFATTIPGIDNKVFSFAARSLSDPITHRELDSYGIKMNVFNSDGSEFTFGVTDNDFGSYIELSLEHIWNYRNKIAFGLTDFNANSDADNRPNSVPISDATFLFFSYTRAISELFDVFGEYSEINTSDGDIDNFLIGLKMSF